MMGPSERKRASQLKMRVNGPISLTHSTSLPTFAKASVYARGYDVTSRRGKQGRLLNPLPYPLLCPHLPPTRSYGATSNPLPGGEEKEGYRPETFGNTKKCLCAGARD